MRGKGATNTSYRSNPDGVSRLLMKGAVRKGVTKDLNSVMIRDGRVSWDE